MINRLRALRRPGHLLAALCGALALFLSCDIAHPTVELNVAPAEASVHRLASRYFAPGSFDLVYAAPAGEAPGAVSLTLAAPSARVAEAAAAMAAAGYIADPEAVLVKVDSTMAADPAIWRHVSTISYPKLLQAALAWLIFALSLQAAPAPRPKRAVTEARPDIALAVEAARRDPQAGARIVQGWMNGKAA